jgi:RNA polymerase-binding transcription factor DksA
MSRSQIEQVTGAAEIEASKRKLTTMLARLASSCYDMTIEREFESPAVDSADQLALDCERNLMLNRLEWMSLLTRQVSEALERIENGAYGVCPGCEQRIAAKRLAALPWVAFCTTCQEERAGIRTA